VRNPERGRGEGTRMTIPWIRLIRIAVTAIVFLAALEASDRIAGAYYLERSPAWNFWRFVLMLIIGAPALWAIQKMLPGLYARRDPGGDEPGSR
jgi:hypothetical protein